MHVNAQVRRPWNPSLSPGTQSSSAGPPPPRAHSHPPRPPRPHPPDTKKTHTGRDAAAEFRAARIPGARFFDTDGVALAGTDLPHMLPPESAFAAAMEALGVASPEPEPPAATGAAAAAAFSAPCHVVAYDGFGTFASPRLWWALRAMGHDRVSVLSGGLPAWRAAGLPVDEAPWSDERDGPIDGGAAAAARAAQQQQQQGGGGASEEAAGQQQYRAQLRPGAAWSLEQMLEAARGNEQGAAGALVLDARPAGRFRGAEPEPRAHLRRGHMPGALNVPFPTLLEGGKDGGLSGARLKTPEGLRAAFAAAGVDVDALAPAKGVGAGKSNVVCSCGSGLTACIVALGLHEATRGKVDAAVYDGSWCEWGAREDTPIVNPSLAEGA
jgi:thiosulfate/3-mercaptopyruvate sulfurtransferase